jgi:hypothetical protein
MGAERLKIREDILKKVTSEEADRVTRHLSVIYLRLVNAPAHLWERDDVLRLTGEVRDGQMVSAWGQLLAIVKVSPRMARKAVDWLHREGIITFYTTGDRTEVVISFEGISGRGIYR